MALTATAVLSLGSAIGLYGAFSVADAADSIAQPGQQADHSAGIKAPSTQPQEDPAVARGRYVAIAGDCAACHTDPRHGKPFAGGYALETPFGKLLASNITSDKNTGIGAWTEQEFTRAVREGKGRHGENLYPAMPYNAYVKVSDQDMHDLWAYMQTVPAVNNEVVSNQLPFPFNIRLMMMGWNLLFFDNTPFKPGADATEQINRGAYLVDGLGHCAACHTPKNFLGGDKGGAYLQGGELAGWHAPEITGNPYVGIGGWSDAQLVQYLKTGSNHVAVASGPMAEAVTNSTQHMRDEDLYAIAAYLKTLPGSDTLSPRALKARTPLMQQGANVYSANCSACHNSDGKGINQLASSLADNPGIQAENAQSLITTVLEGGRGAVTLTNPTSGAMPSFAWKLSDQQIAAILSYIRNSWGNAAPEVTTNQVAEVREARKLPAQLRADGTSH
ncbi:c-type cytochrome [Pseudomonas syringae]|uniref:C-type cytochrome n=1 Tax=Pseudomonas syringae TaxID=317 RepID=A0A9Q3X4T1_PSESX|nr:c-type cytochrome [Pseudomonas syringae]MCF5063845.1 c-type cytochrome [Pseudomonas syringae]MCF5071805.1 c-type cytochrome [Pseudomonas syringae]MCF5116975.1 c-type cytochrome [Pseudomonas syringae]MCF5379635.1 c-type cytochrome [Pseudomonas syringae]